jgi:hypothetical protein
MTFARFDALVDVYNKNQSTEREFEDYRAGVIAAAVLNTIPRTDKTKNKIFHPWDIFPSYDWEPKPEPMNIDQMIVLNAAMGGIIVELN